MAFRLKYINVFNDINSINLEEIQSFYRNAPLKVIDGFKTPSYTESTELQKSMIGFDINSEKSITNHLMSYALLSSDVASTIASGMLSELKALVPSDSALLSNYAKIAYWLKYDLRAALNGVETNVYVQGEIKKYNLYALYITSKLGNNIVLVDYRLNKSIYSIYNNIIFNEYTTNEHLVLSSKIDLTFDEVISVINGTKKLNSPARIKVVGEDTKGVLNSTLIDLADANPDNVLILKLGIYKPSSDEVQSIGRPNAQSIQQLTMQIGAYMFKNNAKYKEQAVDFIKGYIVKNENSIGKAITKLITFICLFNRYNIEFETLVCYGVLDKTSSMYIDFINEIGKTAIIVDVADKSDKSIDESEWTIIKLDAIVPAHKYPEIRRNNTVAYNAQQEINSVLYNGGTLGLYRSRQYKTCDVVNLASTFDEMKLLWKQDNTVRPTFVTTENSITVPVFYAKITGYCRNYEYELGRFITDHTIVCYKPSDIMLNWQKQMVINHFADVKDTSFSEQKPMYKNGQLELDTILNYRTFTYKLLEPGVQFHILNKLNRIIVDGLVAHPGMSQENFVDLVLNVGLNISKRIYQEMQWYDYTKQSPKMVVLCQDEEEITIGQSIVLTLLHLCGWDIILVIPTCFNIFGQHLIQDEIQEHNIGEPKFGTNIKNLTQTFEEEKPKKGFFSKLFG